MGKLTVIDYVLTNCSNQVLGQWLQRLWFGFLGWWLERLGQRSVIIYGLAIVYLYLSLSGTDR